MIGRGLPPTDSKFMQTATNPPPASPSESPLDVAIVGGGPIGLELAVAAAREGLSYTVFEAGQIGHTISWWAPQTRWFSGNERIAIAGVPLESADQSKSTREQYLAYLRAIVRQFDLDVRTFSKVVSVEGDAAQGFTLAVQNHLRLDRVMAKAVVLAVGGTDYPKRLGTPGEDLSHVDSYFREPHRYFGRRVLIIGGRNSAVEAAIRATAAGADVAISYRGPHLPRQSIKYWLLPEIEGMIRGGRVRGYFGTVPVHITPAPVRLRRLAEIEVSPDMQSADQQSQTEWDVLADDVLSLIGYEQDKTLLRQCGIELIGQTQRPSFDETTMMTNVPGIYVAGTAIAGTQSSRYRVFVENCHDHVARIIRSLRGTEITQHSAAAAWKTDEIFQAQIEALPES